MSCPPSTPAYIKAAVESSNRTPEQKARDADRKPAELLVLSGVKPGDRVVEFASFGQYFTHAAVGHRRTQGHGLHV